MIFGISHLVKIGVFFAILTALLLFVLVNTKGRDLIFYPLGSSQGNWEVVKYGGFEECSFTNAQGDLLHGWFFPCKESKLVMLWCGTTIGNKSLHFDQARLFQYLGMSVFIFDYSSYRQSKGIATEVVFYGDALAAYEYLIQKKEVLPSQIVLYGKSLSGAVAIHLANKCPQAKALVVESTPLSVSALMKQNFTHDLPPKWLASQFACLETIATVQIPTLIIHGQQDQVVPFADAEKLFQKCQAKKLLLTIPAGKHNDGYVAYGLAYFKKIHQFISELPN